MVLWTFSFTPKEASLSYLNEPSIEIGKKIYTSGIGEGDQKIIAAVSGRDLPGSMMACVNCHGNCGKGVTLQGVEIPNISRAEYIESTLKDGVSFDSVKKDFHKKIKKVVSMGIKSDGGKIHNLMPRYKMSIKDMNHLLAYLEVLGEDEKCSKVQTK